MTTEYFNRKLGRFKSEIKCFIRNCIESSASIWGGISGTLADQTDLQEALDQKQAAITLTTIGNSGAATLSGATLNIPQYSGGGSSSISTLTDVTLSSLISNNLLKYNGTAWVNTNLSYSDIPNLNTSKITSGTFADARIASATTWNNKENAIAAATTGDYYRGDKTFQPLNKTAVGLSNVPNLDTSNPANITQNSTYRFVTDAEKSTWNNKQGTLTLTTSGSSGAATLVGNTLNIPQYSGGGGGINESLAIAYAVAL